MLGAQACHLVLCAAQDGSHSLTLDVSSTCSWPTQVRQRRRPLFRSRLTGSRDGVVDPQGCIISPGPFSAVGLDSGTNIIEPSQLLVGGMFEGDQCFSRPFRPWPPKHSELRPWRKVLTVFGTTVA